MSSQGSILTCEACAREYHYDMRRGHTRRLCNSCCANRRRHSFKERILTYLGGKCSVCGYCKCPAALQVHHRDPALKRFSLGTAHCRSWSEVEKELETCELLCANCHAEHHFTARDWNLLKQWPRKPERQKVVWPGKSTLRRLLRDMPVTEIGKRIGVSDNAVRKHCARIGLELPKRGRGFWTGRK